jgi:phosphoribosylaminoimidazole-succinocarboxamide synthase
MTRKSKKEREKLYEGTSKILYEGHEEFSLIQFFKDDHVMPNGEVMEISGKGVVNNNISAFIMSNMDMVSIDNHFIEKINMREQIVQLVDMIPIKISVANLACDRYVEQFGIEEGYVFDHPMIDFRIKNKLLSNPVVNEFQVQNLCFLTDQELSDLKKIALRTNDFLTGLFAGVGIRLVECNLEIGRVFDGDQFSLMVADEISPDTCRLWDVQDNRKIDFEFASSNPENAISAYQEIAKRLNV